MAGENNKGMFYYVIANAFLKLYLVVCYLSQSFRGLNINWIDYGHSHPLHPHGSGGGSYSTGYSSGGAGASAYASTTVTTNVGANANANAGAAGSSWKRADLDGHTSGAESWAIWTGWILLCSILPSIIAFMFLVPWAAKVKEKAKKPDAEKPAPKPAPKPEAKPKDSKPREKPKEQPKDEKPKDDKRRERSKPKE